MSDARDECRAVVFRALAKLAYERPNFKAAMDSMGFFTAVELIDTIVDLLGSHRVELCHCGLPVDTGEYRDRGMCTECDTVRCDVDPTACRAAVAARGER